MGVASAKFVHIENQYVGVPTPSFSGVADLGIARIFQSRTRAFTEEYLVSETGPVPFGGRDDELRRLDAWLLDPNSAPRMLVTAPAGRGKSALLVRWMKNLQDGCVCGVNGWQLAFMPISIRTGTSRPEVFYEGLARRLAEIGGEALPQEAFHDGDGFRYAIRDQLDRLAMSGKQKTLVVIDGIDEALEGSFDAGVLPTPMPKNVRVLLSARWQLGDHGSKGWLAHLGWDRGTKVDAFELERLDAARIADVLVKLGAPVEVLTGEPGMVERLAQLTEGEPLLVRYYAEDLWSAGSKGARVTRRDLECLKPGFDSYFKRWFELQEKLWKEEGGGVNLRQVDEVLSILAFALGPLGDADLMALMQRVHGLKGIPALDRLLQPLRRWVFGNGKSDAGYVLSHPKVGEYLQRSRFAAVATQLRQGFADWGKEHCVALNEGRFVAEQASPYCLQFLPEHLRTSKAPPDDFMLMVENGWRCAWEKIDGGEREFSTAVRAALAAQCADTKALRIGTRWRCALALSSVKTLGQNVPTELAIAAVEKGILTFRQAAIFANLKGSSEEGVRLFAWLSFAASDNPMLREELSGCALAATRDIIDENQRVRALEALAQYLLPERLGEALAAAKAIASEDSRAQALTALAIHMQLEEKLQTLSDAFTAAKAIRHPPGRVRAVAALAPHLPPALLDEALTIVKAIVGESSGGQALTALAQHLPQALIGKALAAFKSFGLGCRPYGALSSLLPHLPQEERTRTLREALAAAKSLHFAIYRAEALTVLLPHLPLEEREQMLDEALAAAGAIDGGHETERAEAFAALIPHLPPEKRQEILGEVLAAAQANPIERDRIPALAALAPYLPSEALAAAKAFDEERYRARALAAVAPDLPPKLLGEVLLAAMAMLNQGSRQFAMAALASHLPQALLSDALKASRTICDESHRANALSALVSFLPPEERTKAQGEALAAAKAIGDERQRGITLVALLPYLPVELLGEALATAKAIGDESERTQTLIALAPHLPAYLLGEALTAAKALVNKDSSAQMMCALAPQMPPELLGEALMVAKGVSYEPNRVRALEALIPHLPPELLGEALTVAKFVSYEPDRVRALEALIPHLPPEERRDALGEALAAARVIGYDYARAEALAALIPHLPPDERREVLREVLAAAKAVDDEVMRADALAALIPHLPPELLGEALTVSEAICNEPSRVQALAALIPHLPPDVRPKTLGHAFTTAKSLSEESVRAKALSTLAPLLSAELLDEAVAVAEAIEDDDCRIGVLTTLTDIDLFVSTNRKIQIITNIVDASAQNFRPDCLSAVATTARPIYKLGGSKEIREIRRAVNDVCSWYR